VTQAQSKDDRRVRPSDLGLMRRGSGSFYPAPITKSLGKVRTFGARPLSLLCWILGRRSCPNLLRL